MSGEVINLRNVRKAMSRARLAKKSAENRARFGRTRADRDFTALRLKLEASKLDGAVITTKSEDPDPSS